MFVRLLRLSIFKNKKIFIITYVTQAEDALVSQLSHAIKKVAERVTNAPETVEFDYFSSTNFIGLFITEAFAALLKRITTDFADEMRKASKFLNRTKCGVFVSNFLNCINCSIFVSIILNCNLWGICMYYFELYKVWRICL